MTAATTPARVLVVGDVIDDIIVRPEGPLVIGSDRRAAIRRRPGGSGANQAAWLAFAGLAVRFTARVGAADREPLQEKFRHEGIEAVLTGDADLPTGAIVTILAPDGERSFFTDRGANAALATTDLPVALLADCRLLLVSGYALFAPGPRAAVRALFEAATTRGVPIAVDPASAGFLEEVGPAAFLDWTTGAGLIFANADEARVLTGATAPEAQMRALGQHFARVVIKAGAAGAAFGDRTGIACSRPAPAVTVLDTTGAGDAFAAAFIAADLTGAAPDAALERANAAGALATTHFGGRPPTVA